MAHQLPVLNSEPSSSALRHDGGRNFIIPADVSGRYARRRQIVFALLIVVYMLLPWIRIGGHPAVFLDVEHRAFHLFGGTFNAQDFWLTFFLLSGIGFSLIFVTAPAAAARSPAAPTYDLRVRPFASWAAAMPTCWTCPPSSPRTGWTRATRSSRANIFRSADGMNP